MADGDVAQLGLSGDEKIIATAKERFQRCQDWESSARAHFVQDIKFANADPDNGWQWPNYLWVQRKDDPNGYKPRLTVNKTRQHNLQIKNDMRQNLPGIKVSPVGNEATFQAAQAWQDIIRYIERMSKAPMQYKHAASTQVDAGLGYLRVLTDYSDPDNFDQDIFIKAVPNPLNVYMDPDAKELDASDAKFAFVFEDVPRSEFLTEYPDQYDLLAQSAFGNQNGWIDKDHVRVAEYYTRVLKRDRLVLMIDPESKQEVIARWSQIPPQIRKMIDDNSIRKQREIFSPEVMWYKIAADKVLERERWNGKFIPIVPVVGEQTIIDNILDRKGNTRNLKDAQRMYNFWTSSAVEQVALQTKTRWFIPVGATENLDQYYQLLNTQNYPYIPYNAVDENGNAMPPPTPIEPPTMAEGFIKGMVVANNEFGMASGQREENFGERGQTLSGKAIGQRQQQGDNATFHFKDNLAIAIQQVGNIVVDLVPHIYDTEQVRRILAEDGTEKLIRIDPNATKAYQKVDGDTGENDIVAIFNPTIGRYWVEADVGPSYATRRQEAWDAFVQIITSNQELITVAGDLLFRYADFPGADQMADRLRRLIKPEILGEGPDAALQAAQQQMEQLKQLVQELTEKLSKNELSLRDKAAHERTESFRADSDRLKQLDNAKTSMPEELQPLIEETIRKILAEQPLGDRSSPGASKEPKETVEELANTEVEEPPVTGARKASDGNWYVEHEPGQFSQVIQ